MTQDEDACNRVTAKRFKGKLLLNEHIRCNYFRKTKVVCTYDEFTENNILNRILKLTLRILALNNPKNYNMNEITKLLGYFSDVDDIVFNQNVLNAITINKHNQRFEKALQIAKLILMKCYTKNSIGKENSFSMIFEMNVLYQNYIAYLAHRISGKYSIKVKKQDKENLLLTNNKTGCKTINLNPDIVFEKEEKTVIVDTKWKAVTKGNQLSYSIADIYQMYAYITRYENAMECILLYPRTHSDVELPKWNLHKPYESRAIKIADIRLDLEVNTICDLENLIFNSFKLEITGPEFL